MVKRRHCIAALAIIFIISFTVSACAGQPYWKRSGGLPTSERVDEISDKLITFSLKAESKLRYGDKSIDEKQLKDVVAQSNPQLFKEFKGLALDLSIQGKHVIARVCDQSRQYLIAEDSACTVELDRKDTTGQISCTFTLKANEICLH